MIFLVRVSLFVFDLNETLTSSIEVADVGKDYPGTNLSYILRGAYDVDSSNLSARITWSFENSSETRIDEFTADLSAGDSGDVSMNQVQVTGCDAIVRFAKNENAKADGVKIVGKRNEKLNLTFSGK